MPVTAPADGSDPAGDGARPRRSAPGRSLLDQELTVRHVPLVELSRPPRPPQGGDRAPHLLQHLLPRPAAEVELAPLRRLDLTGSRVVLRPDWVRWTAPADAGAASLLARQSRKRRHRAGRALARLRELRCERFDPITADALRSWRALYDARVRDFRRGVNFAAMAGKELRADHELVTWRSVEPSGDRLVAGVVVTTDRVRSLLHVRFVAVAPDVGIDDLPLAVYLETADLAASRGLAQVSLGTDVNLYGSWFDPGLCTYKLRTGFRAEPALDRGAAVVAERLEHLEGLTAPVLRFCYDLQTAVDVLGGGQGAAGASPRLHLVAATVAGRPPSSREAALLAQVGEHRVTVVERPSSGCCP